MNKTLLIILGIVGPIALVGVAVARSPRRNRITHTRCHNG